MEWTSDEKVDTFPTALPPAVFVLFENFVVPCHIHSYFEIRKRDVAKLVARFALRQES